MKRLQLFVASLCVLAAPPGAPAQEPPKALEDPTAVTSGSR